MSVRVEEEVAECVFVCVCVCSTHFDFFNSKANCWITVIYIFITVKNLLIVPILKLHSWGEKHNFLRLLRSFRTSGPLSSPDTTLKRTIAAAKSCILADKSNYQRRDRCLKQSWLASVSEARFTSAWLHSCMELSLHKYTDASLAGTLSLISWH